jgi:stage V sporulation protein G
VTVITITAVTVVLHRSERLRAFATITIDDSFVVTGLKVIAGEDGRLFTAMPSRKCPNGKFQDIAHPITTEARTLIEDSIHSEYLRLVEIEKEGPPLKESEVLFREASP